MNGSRRLKYVLAAVIVVAAVAAHFRSFSGPFQYDDERDIVYRSAVPEGPLEAAMSSPFRALTYATYAVDWGLGGGDPVNFHATNMFLHAVACLLLFWALRRFYRPENAVDETSVFIGALAFAVHPACSASVDYISGRAGLISAAAGFAMPAVWWRDGFRGRWAVLAALELVALSGKENAVVYPLLLAALWLTDRRGRIGEIIPAFAMALLYGVARVFLQPVVLSEPGRQVSIASHILMQPYVYCRAMFAWFYPIELGPDHQPPPLTGALDPRIWLCALLLVTLVAGAFYLLRRRETIIPATVAAWFSLALAPGATVPLADPVSENRWYFALAAMAAGSVPLVRRAISGKKWGAVFVAVWMASLITLSAATSSMWSDPGTLWARSVRLYPHASRPWSNYAQAAFRADDIRTAEFAARRAVALEAGDALAWNTIGLIQKESGRFEEALASYGKSIEYDPGFYPAYFNRANIYAHLGDYDRAEADYRKTLQLHANYTDACYGLAWVLAARGRNAEAVGLLKKVLDADPGDKDARRLLNRIRSSE